MSETKRLESRVRVTGRERASAFLSVDSVNWQVLRTDLELQAVTLPAFVHLAQLLEPHCSVERVSRKRNIAQQWCTCVEMLWPMTET